MNFLTKIIGVTTIFVSTLTLSGCKDKGLNIFSIQDDITLGQQTKEMIAADPNEYPILNPNTYSSAYAYLYEMRDEILNSGKVQYRSEFPWEIHIIYRDDVVNAFCTPGGFIYIYTGLIKYLDDKSSLAGVLGHEMAHADKRHSTNQLTKKYGIQTLLDVVLGNNQNLLTQIGAELVSLSFSRSDETQADDYSVIYLCPTKFKADGAANFFIKIEQSGGSSVPQFLSTHPNPENRVDNIQNKSNSLNCSPSIDQNENVTGYQAFKNSLP